MNIKPIHKALKALQEGSCHADDSFYPSYITDKKLFLAALETVDYDCRDAVIMQRFEGSVLLPADKIVCHDRELMQ